MSEPHPSRGSALTVQGWQNLVLAVMGLVVLTGAVAGTAVLKRTDNVSDELISNIQPARSAAYQLQAALRDQETGVRGYLLTADPQFLGPYNAGRQAEQEAAQRVRELAAGRPGLLADVDAVEAASRQWRTTFAEPSIAGVARSGPSAQTRDVIERGKDEFDALRALFDIQNDHLIAARAQGIHDLDQMRGWRDRILGLLVGTFLVSALLLGLLTRRALTRPLELLAAACRRITMGNFEEKIHPRGPKDIRGIAVDVDNMRQRIVDELDASRAARTQLAEQAETLDQQAVELRRSNAELEQFAYVASHDLQEPLRKVASFCQLIEKRYGDKLDERGVEYIKFAVDGAKRMQVLINDLLAFSRVGRLHAARTEVDLDVAVDAALNNLAATIDETGAQIVRLTSALPTISGDPTLLTMLWQNLLGNAIKFRRNGSAPRIEIECQRGEDEWLFRVTDNGIGIPAEFVDKVFVIFQRLHSRDAYSGTGIGLALCKKIVEHHGGTIWIDSSYTEGTQIRFTMPVAVLETRAAIPEGMRV